MFMRTHLFRAMLAFVVSLAVTGTALAQGGMIKGKVLDAQGQVVPDAKVSIVATESDARHFETTSDKKGEFIQIGLKSGAYKITATKDKIGTQTLMTTVRQGGSGSNLEFRLSPVSGLTAADTKKMAALHIDSHTDSYPYGEDEKYNSATQFTHVAEEGLVDPEFSWHVGIRSTTYAQGVVPRAMSLGYKIVSLDELVRGGFAQRMAEFRDKVGKRPVYLCFDMDVFDPSCAPGVCTPSWGGLSAREGIDLLRCLTDLNIVAVDVNTVSPPQDVNGMAAHLCAHVIYETLVLLSRQMGLAA